MENQDIYNKNIIEIYTVAVEFCAFTESLNARSKEEIFQFYVKILPLLYLKGTLMPEIDNDENYPSERFVNEEDWSNVFETLKQKLGFQDVFSSTDDEGIEFNVIDMSISENIADIYQDMKDFVILYSKSMTYQKSNSVADLRNLFISHWGIRICRLLSPLHELAFM